MHERNHSVPLVQFARPRATSLWPEPARGRAYWTGVNGYA